jgi:hypothetical protein
MNSKPLMWLMLPLPPLPKMALPGFALIQAIRPLRSSGGSVFLPARKNGASVSSVSGWKSFNRSYGSL